MRVLKVVSILVLLFLFSPQQAISNSLSQLSKGKIGIIERDPNQVLELAKAQAKHPHTRQLAIDNLRNFLLLDPNNISVKKTLVETLSCAGKHEDAISLSSEIHASNENDLEVLLCHAKALSAHKDSRTRGLEAYEKYLQRNPADYDAMNDYAEVLVKAGHKQRALTMFQQLIESEPANLKLKCHYGQVLSCAGNLDGALRVYQCVLLSEPENVGALIGAGVCSMYTCCPISAEKYFKSARQKSPNDSKVFLLSAQNFQRMGRLDKARNTLDKCLTQTQMETDDLFARSGMGETVVTIVSHK